MLLGGDSFFRGTFVLPAESGTIQRVMLIVAVGSFSASWLLEDAYQTLNRRALARLNSDDDRERSKHGAPPPVRVPENSGYTAPTSEQPHDQHHTS